jgi:hypothetical protein
MPYSWSSSSSPPAPPSMSRATQGTALVPTASALHYARRAADFLAGTLRSSWPGQHYNPFDAIYRRYCSRGRSGAVVESARGHGMWWPTGGRVANVGNVACLGGVRMQMSSSARQTKGSMQAPVDLSLFSSVFARRAAVGNSPLILDESSDHGLGQRYHHLDAARYCSENSPTFQTT